MSSQVSAAERAELRRQKILAKKKARMAYAAGDHSRLPSTAPPEEIIQETQPCPVTTNALTHHQTRSHPLEEQVEQVGKAGQVNPAEKGPELLDILKSRLFRCFLLGITAIAFACFVHMGIVEAWRISAVEVFACAELCLLLPRMMKGTQTLLRQSGSGRSAMGPLWMLSCAQDIYSTFNGVMCDFSAYMICFLYTWYLLAKQ